MATIMDDESAQHAADEVRTGADGARYAAVHARLTAERDAVNARIEALDADYQAIVEANALVAVDDEHDPEGQSTAFERAHVASLLTLSRDQLEKLEAALERLAADDYGRCAECGRDIPVERLEIRPEATRCVRCAAAPRRR
ncbi:TraR/DksA family transcriptional regulator [Streptomyces polyrhachis]|uniref:TraR/DksA family transcriptional regulator n=1 Tax=Streptomyces polyrhachis TaxID=1282885 RepID=A0ABW2GED7_9ACTN